MEVLTKEFVFNEPLPTPECHASTVICQGNKLFVTYTYDRKKIAVCEIAL